MVSEQLKFKIDEMRMASDRITYQKMWLKKIREIVTQMDTKTYLVKQTIVYELFLKQFMDIVGDIFEWIKAFEYYEDYEYSDVLMDYTENLLLHYCKVLYTNYPTLTFTGNKVIRQQMESDLIAIHYLKLNDIIAGNELVSAIKQAQQTDILDIQYGKLLHEFHNWIKITYPIAKQSIQADTVKEKVVAC